MTNTNTPLHKAFLRLAALVITLLLFSGETFLSNTALAQEPKVGRFATNYGPLILYQGKKDRLAGFYYYQGLPAHLFLSRKANGSYKGIWVQATSERKCARKKNGSPYWGSVNAAFKGNKFLALWNYCNDPLINKKEFQWKGILK